VCCCCCCCFQVAIYRARGGSARLGNLAEAARRLSEYLSTFCSDAEGWLMLHELYLLTQQYKRASFCIEELILINPMSYIYHVQARGHTPHCNAPLSL